MSGISVSPSFSFSSLQSKNHSTSFTRGFCSVNPRFSSLPDTNLRKQLGLRFGTPTRTPHGISVRCNSSTRPAGPGSGDNESRNVLDAFFVGKALAEALSERIESTVGDLLNVVGRLQAEQQRQIQDFQVDVLERAKRAKENAAREAIEAQGLVSNATGASPANPPSPNSTVVRTAERGRDPAAEGPASGG